MTLQQRFLDDLSSSRMIRTSVRAIIVHEKNVLVQQPSDEPDSCCAFIGGQVEFGELLEERLRKELSEELGAKVGSARYLFFVENRFLHGGRLVHLHEHFFQVDVESDEIRSLEPGLIQKWLPLARLADFDVRPHVARDAVFRGAHSTVRHLIVPL
jgi:ADP-ribose pyrophosphatase YjhB (NUDIX family)